MREKLAIQGMIKLIVGIVTLGLLLFLPAGTFHFLGAWRMIGVLFIPMLILGTILLIVKPELLAKRLNQKETEDEQKSVIFFSLLLFVACFLLCGFDFRFGWSALSFVGILRRLRHFSCNLCGICRTVAGKRVSFPYR